MKKLFGHERMKFHTVIPDNPCFDATTEENQFILKSFINVISFIVCLLFCL